MDYPFKIKLHDSFIVSMDEFTWHGVQHGHPQSPLTECPTEELVPKIREFLSKKERLNFYKLIVPDFVCYKSFSDEDVELIKKEFKPDFENCLNVDENGNEIEGVEWYSRDAFGSTSDPICQLTEDGLVYAGDLIAVDFGHAEHYYAMSRSFCDVASGEIKKTSGFGVSLSDDDYVYLVHQIIAHNHEYFFTDLTLDDPELARKIYLASMWSKPFKDEEVKHLPYLISFDELEEDARAIESLESK